MRKLILSVLIYFLVISCATKKKVHKIEEKDIKQTEKQTDSVREKTKEDVREEKTEKETNKKNKKINISYKPELDNDGKTKKPQT